MVRLANRPEYNLTADEITDLIHLGEMLTARIESKEDRDLVTARHVLTFWKESFDEAP